MSDAPCLVNCLAVPLCRRRSIRCSRSRQVSVRHRGSRERSIILPRPRPAPLISRKPPSRLFHPVRQIDLGRREIVRIGVMSAPSTQDSAQSFVEAMCDRRPSATLFSSMTTIPESKVALQRTIHQDSVDDGVDPWQPFGSESIAKPPVRLRPAAAEDAWKTMQVRVVKISGVTAVRDSAEDPWQPASADP